MNTDSILGIAICGGALALAILGIALRVRRTERESRAGAAPVMAPAVPALAEEAPAEMVAAPAAAPAPAAVEAPPPPEAAEPAAPDPAPAAGPDEVLRVLRGADRALLVEIEGQTYRSVNEIKDQTHGLALVDAVMELQRFLGLDLVASLATKEPEEVEAALAPPPGHEPIQKPSLNPIRQMMILRDRELKKARERREAGPQPTTIVEEIEAILVKRLVGSPFEGRSIHMRPGLHGGAHIDVDGQAYEAIDDIADEEVKQFLKSVIAEWEAGQR